VKCPECVKEGERSRVSDDGCSSTLLGGGGPFWDEDGNKHIHDPNRITQHYHCSRGHHWAERGRAPCPSCDWANL
jgi:hypothetical protein